MPATPIIQTSGSVSGAGTAGVGREDFVPGETVTFSDTEPLNTGLSYSWELVESPENSTATLTGPATATPTLVPDSPRKAGSWIVKCTVEGSWESYLIVAVPLAAGGRIPARQEEEGVYEYNGGGNVRQWAPGAGTCLQSLDDRGDNAFHDNETGEFNALTAKTVPIVGDILALEDSAASWAKAKSTIAQILAVANQINALTAKTVPVVGDKLAIEDSAASWLKKASTIAEILAVANQINALTAKTTPVDADVLAIEDSAASWAKKKLTLANLGAYLDKPKWALIEATGTDQTGVDDSGPDFISGFSTIVKGSTSHGVTVSSGVITLPANTTGYTWELILKGMRFTGSASGGFASFRFYDQEDGSATPPGSLILGRECIYFVNDRSDAQNSEGHLISWIDGPEDVGLRCTAVSSGQTLTMDHSDMHILVREVPA